MGRVYRVGPLALAMTTGRPSLYPHPIEVEGSMLGRVSASLQLGNLATVSQQDGRLVDTGDKGAAVGAVGEVGGRERESRLVEGLGGWSS